MSRTDRAGGLLVPSAALLWGLQFSLLTPALALLLVTLFDATAGEVGWVLVVYNASGFVASLVVPAYADRTADYLRPMLACGVLTVALTALLASTTALPVAVVGLLALGGPAGVGTSLLFAHLRHAGASPSDVVRTRAMISFAWVAGPPAATFIIASFGDRAIFVAVAAVAALNIATTAAMLAGRGAPPGRPAPTVAAGDGPGRGGVALIVAAFVALQATNAAVVAIMSVFVTQTLDADVMWAGVALGVAAALEVPALLLIGRLADRVSSLALIASGCIVGMAYYVAMAFVSGPVALVALQALNAWFFAVVAGVGLTLFQQVVARPGLASGLYANTRRVGAIVSGPIIALGSLTTLGYRAIFAACAALTLSALVAIGLVRRTSDVVVR